VLKLEGDFKVSVCREVNGENKREIISEHNFEKCQFSEPVKILPINLIQNEKNGRIYSRLHAYRRE
jgi:galactofuranosylgalactofuranosylrhamnosyl-N-acetylglucosaminyl-diphospho-decaprenol beta-1,5/1,6-galactofuranosyltransferase